MYAVIESGGKQYRVELGMHIQVDRLDVDPGQTVTFERVLLVADAEEAFVGRPLVEGAVVSADVVRQERGEKIVVFKYRPKARRRVKKGHRAELTTLRIADISHAGRSAAAEEARAAAERERAAAEAREAAARQAAADQALAARLAKAAVAEDASPEAQPATRASRTPGARASRAKAQRARSQAEESEQAPGVADAASADESAQPTTTAHDQDVPEVPAVPGEEPGGDGPATSERTKDE